jgi:hypothetical protein
VSPLAVLLLAVATSRVESVSLASAESRLAVRVALSGTPGRVAVHREGSTARVSIAGATLGLRFAGGQRFEWTPAEAVSDLAAATPARLDRLEIASTASEVSLLLHAPPEVAVDVARDPRGLLIRLRAQPVETVRAVEAPSAETPAPVPVIWPPPLEAMAPASPAPVATIAEPPPAPAPAPAPALAEPTPPAEPGAVDPARLFPTATAAAPPGSVPPAAVDEPPAVADLYARLFPGGAPQAAEPEAALSEAAADDRAASGVAVGPFRVRASVEARYVDADTFVEDQAATTRDRYLEVLPRIAAEAPVGAGLFEVEYGPALRAFATYDQVNSSSHLARVGLGLPVGPNVTLRAGDRFVAGTLDTRYADPGGEYFFGLGRFHRNDVDAGASVAIGPRTSLELGGAIGAVRFQEDSTFFDYDTRLVSAGIGYELGPSLKAVAAYVYDTVPRPDEREEAEASAHSAQLTLRGDVLALLTGELGVGYRRQSSPNAGPGGERYSGLVFTGSLERQLGPESSLAIRLSRATPVSAFEENAFYVSTAVGGSLGLPLPLELELRGGLDYRWNDYRTLAADSGAPREDRILGWFVGLRRPLARGLYASGAYRAEDRRSNLDRFDVDADGFFLQLEWSPLGAPAR